MDRGSASTNGPAFTGEPLARCASCGELLYAEFPLRIVAPGAMHVGCHLLWVRHRVTYRANPGRAPDQGLALES